MMGLLILLGAATLVLLCGLAAMLAFEMRHPPRHTMAYALARGMPCDPGEVGLDFDQWWLDRPDGASPGSRRAGAPEARVRAAARRGTPVRPGVSAP